MEKGGSLSYLAVPIPGGNDSSSFTVSLQRGDWPLLNNFPSNCARNFISLPVDANVKCPEDVSNPVNSTIYDTTD